ncbi:MAG: hypothetical protein AAGC46_20260, partial [Solirubrobacteraceae bacterium]
SGALSTLNGQTYWTGSATIPGDLPALADITGTWADSRRQVAAAVTNAAPTVIAGTALTAGYTGWASGTAAGSSNSNVLTGAAPLGTPSIVATTTIAAATTNAVISTRVMASVVASGTWPNILFRPDGVNPYLRVAITVNGREVAVSQQAVLTGTASGATSASVWRPWRRHRTPRLSLRAGDVVGVSIGFVGADSATVGYVATMGAAPVAAIDWLAVSSERASATVDGRDPVTSAVVAGDSFATAATGNLNGRTGDRGGTWTAVAGTTYSSSGATNWPGTVGGTAYLGSVTGAAFVSARVKMPASAPSAGLALGLRGSTNAQVAVVMVGPSTASGAFSATAGNSSKDGYVATYIDGGTYDINVTIDEAGRWTATVTSGAFKRVTRGHCTELAGATVRGFVEADAAVILKSFTVGTCATAASTGASTWTADSRASLAGDTPTFAAGVVPVVLLAAADTNADAPAAPNPTAVTVTATPRWLQVPR